MQTKSQNRSRTTLVATLGLIVAASAGYNATALAQSTVDTDQAQPHSASVGAAIDDTAITAKVKAKYLDDTRLKNAKVSVTTTNGVVTLTGSAPDADSKSAAESLAQSVSGVKSVDNQITSPSMVDTVAAKTDRAAHKTGKVVSDSWITTKVKSKLVANEGTKGFDISVTTNNGVVALSGTVPSETVASQAKAVASKVHGVKSVDASNLKTTTQ